MDSCSWKRLTGVSGEFSDIIAIDNAHGQFYVEILDTDKYFRTGCVVTPLDAWPTPAEPLSKIEIGTYMIGRDVSPGIYAGRAGTGTLDSCSWKRLTGVSGEFSDIIAIDNAHGQFYVEILDTDKYFRTGCVVTPLDAWPTPAEPLSKIEIGTYMIGRDVSPGIYAGRAGTGTLDSCSWKRLTGVSGEFSDIIAIDNAHGQFYVEILDTDKYFRTGCVVTPLDAWPTPAEPLSKIEIGTYMIGRDVSPGIYAGRAGTGTLDSCSWKRLTGVSGEFSDIIAIDNAHGQFYVEILDTDKYFRTGCVVTPLDAWPTPAEPLSKIEIGTYMIGRDVSPGIYAGRAGTGTLDSCSWKRLTGVSGEFSDIIAIDNAHGQFYVEILDTDKYFRTGCMLELVE